MKNLISKKLALLAIVLFASIGHAFGAITVSITDDKGVAVDDVVNVGFSSPNCFMETDKNGVLEFLQGEDSGWMNVHLLSSLYQITKIKIDDVDVMSSCDYDSSNGYYYYHLDPLPDDYSVSIEVVKLEPYTITVTLKNDAYANVVFFDGAVRHNRYNNEPVTLGKGRNVKMYIDPAAGFEISQVKVEDDNDNVFYITDSYNEPGGYYEFESPNVNYYVSVSFSSVNTKTITVNYDEEEAWVSLRKYKNDPDKGNVYGTTSGEASEFNQGYNFRLNVGLYNDTYQVTSIIDNNEEKISEYRANNYYDFILSEDHTIDMSFGLAPSVTVNFDSNKGYVRLNDGGIGPSTSHYFSTGSTIKIQPYTFSDRYWVSSVTVNDEPITKTDDYYAFTLTENSTVNVLFEENPSVTVYFDEDYGNVVINENSDNIWALVSEPYYFSVGSTVRITPHPNTGYIVSSFAVDGEPVTLTNGYYEFTLTENCYISVEFERPTHTITYSFNRQDLADVYVWWSNGSCTVSRNSSINVPEGSDVSMWTDWIDGSYQVKSFKVGDVDYTESFTSGDYSLSNVTSDLSVYVELETIQPSNAFNVSFNHEGFGDICINDNHIGRCVSKNQTIDTNMGDNIWVSYYLYSSAHPLKSITIDNVDVTNEFKQHDGYSIPNNSSDHSIYVEYDILESNTISVILQEGHAEIKFEDGDIAVWGQEALFAKGHSVKMYLTPTAGSEISSVSIDDGSNIQDVSSYFQANGGYYEFTSLNADYTVTVQFTQVDTRTITINYNNERGSVYLNNKWVGPYEYAYNEGSTIRLTTNPRGGYKVGSIFVDEEEVTNFYNTNGYYEFVLNSDYTVTVNFVEATYYNISVTCDDTEHGSYWISENGEVIEGTNIELSVDSDTGYMPIVTDNGTEVVLTEENGYYYYTINNLDADHTINVRFDEAETSNIYLSINENETVVYLNNNSRTGSGYFTLTTGTTARLVVDPQIGYELESIIIDNDDVTDDYKANGYYDLVVSECTITVTMKKKLAPETIPFTLSDLGIGTFCCEFDLDFSNVRGIKAYVASGFNPISKQLVLTKVDEVPAGTGILIKGSYGEYQIPTTETYFCYANMLKGVVKDTYIPENSWEEGWNGYGLYAHYLLGDDGEFYRANGEDLPATSAYLTIPTKYVDDSSLAKIGLIFVDDEEEVGGITTGVGYIWAGENRTVTTDAIYNLQGQKITEKSLKPGIYIKNGKKFMVK